MREGEAGYGRAMGDGPDWDEALDRAAAGFRAALDEGALTGVFSCSKATNELNFAPQKFARVVLGTNNVDSCNRT